jgi:hypothetical protein
MTIQSWRELYTVIHLMGEEQLRNAINHEVATYKRGTIIARLHSRYCKLRSARERELLVKGETLL